MSCTLGPIETSERLINLAVMSLNREAGLRVGLLGREGVKFRACSHLVEKVTLTGSRRLSSVHVSREELV